MKTVGKIVVSVISLILVIGVALAVVAVVSHEKSKETSEKLTPQMKSVSAICSRTDYQQECQETLNHVSQNSTTDPKLYIEAAVKATIEEVTKGLNLSDKLIVEAPANSTLKMSLQDCKDMLHFAIGALNSTSSKIGEQDMPTLNDRKADLLNWLSSVVSYKESCLDGFVDEDKFKKQMGDGLDLATRLTGNALAIVAEISNILEGFGSELNIKPNSGRRLLGETEVDKHGFPTWFSKSDRKLLGLQDRNAVKPHVTVAKDGSGQFKTINDALNSYPKNFVGRYIIYVKAGIYDEYVIVTREKKNIFMYGDGPRRTIVRGRKSFRDGITTMNTATFAAVGDGFLCKSMGFQNNAGPEGHQAVALRVQSDASVFLNCRMDGYQDTLYVQANRQFYRNCVISGTVDFIFGDSVTVIQNCLIIVRRPMNNQQNTVTAQGRKLRQEITGLVIHNCRIVPEQKLFAERFQIPTYLGRPWKEFARTVIIESTLADFVRPEGYLPWQGTFALDTCLYAEYGNRGPGARTDRRVTWKGFRVINRNEALQYTAGIFLKGGRDFWLKDTGAPFLFGLKA